MSREYTWIKTKEWEDLKAKVDSIGFYDHTGTQRHGPRMVALTAFPKPPEETYLDYSWDAGTSKHIFALNENMTWNQGFCSATKTVVTIPGTYVGKAVLGMHCDSRNIIFSGSRFTDEWALVAQASVASEVYADPFNYEYPSFSAPYNWDLGARQSLVYLPLALYDLTGPGVAGSTCLRRVTPAQMATLPRNMYCGLRWQRASDGSSLTIYPDFGEFPNSYNDDCLMDTAGRATHPISSSQSWVFTASAHYQRLVLYLNHASGAYTTTDTSPGSGDVTEFVVAWVEVDVNLRLHVYWSRPIGLLPASSGVTGVYFKDSAGTYTYSTRNGVILLPHL